MLKFDLLFMNIYTCSFIFIQQIQCIWLEANKNASLSNIIKISDNINEVDKLKDDWFLN